MWYRPNSAARALRLGTARSMALVVPDVTNLFFRHVIRGAQAAAWTAGYLLGVGHRRTGRTRRPSTGTPSGCARSAGRPRRPTGDRPRRDAARPRRDRLRGRARRGAGTCSPRPSRR